MIGGRDRGFEAAFFENAERQAGLYGLGTAELAAARLDLVGERHGDRWLQMPLQQFVLEIRAEGVDLLGWPVLMAQRLMLGGIGEAGDCQLEARLKLGEIAALGVQVERKVRELQGLLE